MGSEMCIRDRPNEGIPRALGQRCATCSLGKVCVARPPGVDFDADAFCARKDHEGSVAPLRDEDPDSCSVDKK